MSSPLEQTRKQSTKTLDFRKTWHCKHCSTPGTQTPALRKGPLGIKKNNQGPKTLCNACGVFYTRNGYLPPHRDKNKLLIPIITQSRIQGPLSALSAGSWTIPSPLDNAAKSAPTETFMPEWDGIDLDGIDAMMTLRNEFDFSDCL